MRNKALTTEELVYTFIRALELNGKFRPLNAGFKDCLNNYDFTIYTKEGRLWFSEDESTVSNLTFKLNRFKTDGYPPHVGSYDRLTTSDKKHFLYFLQRKEYEVCNTSSGAWFIQERGNDSRSLKELNLPDDTIIKYFALTPFKY